MSPIPARVSWFEIATNDVARSAEFYGALFGWTFDGDAGVYLSVPPAAGGIAGGLLPAAPSVGPYATFGVMVDDVDIAYTRALELGAAPAVAPTDNPGGVRSAYLRDTDGSLFAIYRFAGAPASSVAH